MAIALILSLVALAVAVLAWRREAGRRRDAVALVQQERGAQQLRRETELREQSERTAALFDRMVEGVIVTDAAGSIRIANRAAGELFGFAAPAAGLSILEATRHHGVSAVASQLDRETEIIDHELTLESATQPRHLQVNALALRSSDGSRDGAIFVFHDLTRLRRLEAMRQDFVANVSHELRTPLSLIKSATESLLEGGRNDPAVLIRFLEIIDRHTNRLSLLIDDLLLLSALDSGQLKLELQTVLLAAAVREVLDELAPRASARSIVLENAVSEGLSVRADGHRLHQVLINLVDNAIKYGREGGRTMVKATALGDGRIEVAVQDDGPGLAPEAKARVFERFYRVDKARSREQGGTGLGLAIVKRVVQAHGGEVRVESEPGAGATFSFTLPPTS